MQRRNMKLYNTLSRSVDEFFPVDDTVKLYVCGITPYDTTHLGHAFTYTSVDILVRYLEFKGYPVMYVQNVTDIDDDILRKANEVNEDWSKLVNRWTAHFIHDMKILNVRPPNHYPCATDMISQIIDMVSQLMEAGVSYENDGNVYFQISKWQEFGKLCQLPYEEMLSIANERGNNPDDENKNDALDFILWQAKSPGEPSWESPWGEGRPGWHIECSAMSTHFLDKMIDIHAGGQDLCFPHHEAEIAQVEPISDVKPFVRWWMHIAMVYHDDEKMSKSLGNLIMARELLERYSPDAIRLYLGSHQYRQTWSHDEDELLASQKLANDVHQAVIVESGSGEILDGDTEMNAFISVMDDDLNTVKATKILSKLVYDVLEGRKTGKDISLAQKTIRKMGEIFGLRLDGDRPEERVEIGWNKLLRRFSKEDIPSQI
jgi:cysteinyl-tRNA synthetase